MGSVPFGYLVCRLARGIDIRSYGSGNIGATNVLRTLGPWPALATALLDVAKGAGSVLIARAVGQGEWVVAAAGLACGLGGSFSPLLGFSGGKGIAVGTGVLVALVPRSVALGAAAFAAAVVSTRYVSLGSILGCVVVPAASFALGEPRAYCLLALALGAIAVARHRSNIKRLLAGSESRLGERVRVR